MKEDVELCTLSRDSLRDYINIMSAHVITSLLSPVAAKKKVFLAGYCRRHKHVALPFVIFTQAKMKKGWIERTF